MRLFYDWETQDLFIKGIPSEDPAQPGGVSLSAILDDDEGVTRAVMSMIIKHDKVSGEKALATHGITPEIANAHGFPLEFVMATFFGLAVHASTLVAFNHHFDFKFVKIACARIEDGEGMRELCESKSYVCTMEAAAPVVKGPKQRFVTLALAHEHLLGKGFDGAHNSLADAYAQRAIYYELKGRGLLPEPKPLTRRVYATPAPGAVVAQDSSELSSAPREEVSVSE